MKLATFAFFSLPFLLAAQDVRIAPVDEPARLLTAGQQTSLTVLVTGSGGAPVGGATVTFIAPPSNPSGLFVGDDGLTSTRTYQAVTRDDGTATASYEAGTQVGSYFVYARTPGSSRSAIFGISNVPARTPAPALSASAARRTLESKIPQGGAVYGPVWLPSLTTVAAAGPASIYAPSSSFTTAATGSWLFWVDPNPDQLFGHSVEYVTVDVSRTDASLPSARFSRELWWPMVRLSGSSIWVHLLPSPVGTLPGSADGAACAIIAASPASQAAIAGSARVADLLARLGAVPRYATSRDDLRAAVQTAVDQNCSSVYLHITANGYPPRVPRPDAPGASLGGIILSVSDPIEYTDLAKLLVPLKDKARLQVVIDASYSGNAIGAFSGLGLRGELLTSTDDSSPQPTQVDGTAFSAELTRMWSAAIDAGRAFDLGQVQVSSRVKVRYATIVPDGPKVLPLPNFNFGGPSQLDKLTITVPDDFPAGSTVSAKVSVAEPRIAELDPSNASGAPGKDLPALTVLSAGPGVTTYTVQLSAGEGAPAYQGKGTLTVGQEVSCSPSRISLTGGYTADLRIARGALYDSLFNGSAFNVRLIDDRMAKLSTSQVTVTDSATVQLTGYVPGTTSLEVTGTRAWGQPYTACIVEVVVVPEFGDGTLTGTLQIAQTDVQLQKVTPQVRVQSDSVEDITMSGDLLCATGIAPFYSGLGVTQQSYQQSFQGKTDAYATCFWPATTGSPAAFRFTTLFGGKEADVPVATVADADGNVWVVGYTESKELPVTAGGHNYLGRKEIFLAKFSRFGDRLLFSSYFGGLQDEVPTGAVVDGSGNLIVTGYTLSRDFPVTNQAVQSAFQDGVEAFIFKLNGATGALMFSTLYGGRGDDYSYGIAVDGQGSIYIAGQTASHSLPVTAGAFQPNEADGPPCLQVGEVRPCPDGFVAKFSPDLSRLIFATFLGGTDNDYAYGVAVDGAGNVAVVGGTSSADFPTTEGAPQRTHRPGLCAGFYPCQDAFVTVLNPAGTALVASTFLGGDSVEEAAKAVFDKTGNLYVYGRTTSSNLPVTNNAFQRQYKGAGDAFIATYAPGLKTVLGLTYMGSSGIDNLGGLVVTQDGKVYFGISTGEKDLRF